MISYLGIDDKQSILNLALQVEKLFGKMVGVEDFENALNECLKNNCVIGFKNNSEIWGAGIIDKGNNEIEWFVVDDKKRGQGIGSKIMDALLNELDERKDIYVQTFAKNIPEGETARKLYIKYGFVDERDGGLNPAGIPTVIMVKNKK